MLATRRSVATALLGVTSACLLLFHPAVVGSSTGVASADENVRIESPADGAPVMGVIDLRVTATAADPSQIDFYRIYVGNGRSPSAMRPVGPPRTAPVENEVVAQLDTTLLMAGEATIQLRLFQKGGDQIDATVVVNVQVGPTPTRVLSGPVISVPQVAIAPPPPLPAAGPAGVEFPNDGLIDVSIPDFGPVQRSTAPISQLTPDYVYDTMAGDPIQDDPILDDLNPISPRSAPAPLNPIPR